jgi:dTDP-glucose 4,6-dehydratase
MILVTGGAGFIGANFVLEWCAGQDEPIVNLDKLTYAGNIGSLAPLAGKRLPVYGDGLNVRDWLYVGDHCAALRTILAKGRAGETYNVGGNAEIRNVEVVRAVCRVLAELVPDRDFARLISFVQDRPGHDRRYAIDATKIRRDLGWTPRETFETGLRRTVRWYLEDLPAPWY